MSNGARSTSTNGTKMNLTALSEVFVQEQA